jgi:hypothetical protein
MPQARSYLFKQQSSLSTYSDSTNVIQINLPRLQRSYLTKESYLRFLVSANFQPGLDATQNTLPARYLALDQVGAYGLIDKIEIYDYLGSTLLESTAGHGQLMSLLMDLNVSQDERKNHFNMMAGTSGGVITSNSSALNNVPLTQTNAVVSATAGLPATVGSVLSCTVTTTATSAVYFPKPGDFVTLTGGVSTTGSVNVARSQIITVGNPVQTAGGVFAYTISYFSQSAATGTVTTQPTAIAYTPQGPYYSTQTSQTLTPSATGELFYAAATADGTNVTVTKEYTIPLFSFLGSLSDKFAPLHNGYTIMITLNSSANAFCLARPVSTADQSSFWNQISAYNISNVYMEAQILELGPVAESMLLGSTGGQPLIIPTKAFRNYVGSVPAGSSAYRLDINLNVASLTNILWIQRLASDLNNITYRSLTQRVRNYVLNWYFQYGSSVLPQTSGITASDSSGGQFNEAYAELLKARHSLLTDNFNTVLNRNNYAIDTPGVYPTGTIANTTLARIGDYFSQYESGKFAAGIDLELVTGKSGDLVCGMNTNGMNTSIFVNFVPGSSPANTRLDLWAEYDAFINISPGLATTVSF